MSRPVDELLVHGDVLLASAAAEPLRDGALLVRDGAIAEVGARDDLRRAHPGVEELGGTGMLVMPGLTNAHHHGMGISTIQLGFPDPGMSGGEGRVAAFEWWMSSMLLLDAVDPYLDALYKDVLLLESGVTSHLHMHYPSGASDPTPADAWRREVDESLRAHRDAGQRVTVAPHWRDRSRLAYDGDEDFVASLPGHLRDGARGLAASRIPNERYLEAMAEIHASLAGEPLLDAQLAIMAPQWASDALVEAVGATAADRGMGIHLHALESPLQRAWGDAHAGGRELERLVEAGVIGPRSAVAHGVQLRPADIALLAGAGAAMVHNPASNVRLANGVAPLRALAAAGVQVAIGMDDMAFADDDDMLSELRLAHVLQRVTPGDEPAVRSRELFGFAWDGGARVIGAGSLVGRLEPGRRADVVLVDLAALSAPWAIEGGDVWDLLLARGKAGHVRSVLVDGRVLLRDRVLTHLDRAALAREVADAAAAAVAARDARQWGLVREIGAHIVRHYSG